MFSCHFERQDGLHGADAAVWVCAGEGEGVVLDVVVVGDQVKVEIVSIVCIIGVVNDGVMIELLNGLLGGFARQCLE